MRHKILSLLGAAFLVIGLSAGVALAQNNQGGDNNNQGQYGRRAPEIDLAAGVGALTLLAGGLLVVRGRKR